MSFGGIALGARGERLATDWYRNNGYSVIARNWRCDIGEIDLVCARNCELVIAEVKTRTSERFGAPSLAVGVAKQRKLRQLASVFLGATEVHYDEIRFDVVSIVGNVIEVIEAAF